MSRLGREWERREEQRQQLLKQKVTSYSCRWSQQREEESVDIALHVTAHSWSGMVNLSSSFRER